MVQYPGTVSSRGCPEYQGQNPYLHHPLVLLTIIRPNLPYMCQPTAPRIYNYYPEAENHPMSVKPNGHDTGALPFVKQCNAQTNT